jgi:hypothetical protein
MKVGFVIATVLITFLRGGQPATAGDIPRAPLDRIWEEHMLAGTPVHYSSGRLFQWQPWYTRFPERSRGSWVLALATPRGMIVSDYRGTRLLGVLRGGGWSLHGGLLDRFDRDGKALELYVKVVSRVHPGLFDNSAPPKEQSYEFFLLCRPQKDAQAVVVRSWTIRPDEVHWYVPEYLLQGPLRIDDKALLSASETSDVRGFLTYESESNVALVTVTGLTHPFEERVDLSSALGRCSGA